MVVYSGGSFWFACGIAQRSELPGGAEKVSDLAVESAPDVAVAAHEAARGQIVYITEHGNRVAGIVPGS